MSCAAIATPKATLDRESPTPLYFQVERILEANICAGLWQPDEQIPTEDDLCELFSVSRSVVRQALRDLEVCGLVRRIAGKGTFVAKPKVRESLIQSLTGFYEDAVAQGRRPFSRVMKQQVIAANAGVAQWLKLNPDEPVICIHRLRFLDGEPFVLSFTHIPFERCPQLIHEDLAKESLYALLENKYGLCIEYGRRFVEAVSATPIEAELLGVKRGAPLILLRTISYLTDDTPIEYDIGKHRGDRTRFEVELLRQHR